MSLGSFDNIAEVMNTVEQNLRRLKVSQSTAPISDDIVQGIHDVTATSSPTDFAEVQSPIPPISESEKKTAEELQKERKRDDFWSAVGEIWNVPEQIATSLLVNAGTLSQSLANIASGESGGGGASLQDQLADAWDWQSIHDEDRIDIGTAFLFAVGQFGRVTSFIPTAAINLLDNREAAQEVNKTIEEFGLGFTSGNFNIFSEEDRSYMSGEKGTNIGSIMRGTFNFVGDIATDPLTYVPFGAIAKLGKGVIAGRRMMSEKALLNEFKDTARIAYGKDTAYTRELTRNLAIPDDPDKISAGTLEFFEFIARTNDVGTISRHSVFRSINDAQRDNIAYLATKMNSAEDAAQLWLAVQYGETRSIVEIAKKYDAFFEMDSLMNEGGQIVQTILKNPNAIKSIDELLPVDYKVALDELIQKEAFGEFGDILKAASSVVDNSGNTVLRNAGSAITTKSIASSKALNQFEGLSARVRANILIDGDTTIYRWVKPGKPIIHFISRPFQASSRHHIDVVNMEGNQRAKLVSYYEELDRYTKGKFSQSGKRAEIDEAWSRATTPEARRNVVYDLQQEAITQMAIAKGISRDTAEEIGKAIRPKLLDTSKKRRQDGTNITPDGRIDHEPAWTGQLANGEELVELKILEKQLAKENDLGTLEMIGRNLRAGGTLAQTATSQLTRFWTGLTLMSPRRVPRELMQGSLSAFLSGHWLNGLGNRMGVKNPLATLKGTFGHITENARTNGQNIVHKTEILNPAVASEKQLTTTANSLDEAIRALDEDIAEYSSTHLDELGKNKISDFTDEELEIFFDNKLALSEGKIYHFADDAKVFDKALDEDRMVLSFGSADEATKFGRTKSSEIKPSGKDGMFSDAQKKEIGEALENGREVFVEVPGKKPRLMTTQDFNSIIKSPQASQTFTIRVYNGVRPRSKPFTAIGREVELSPKLFDAEPQLMKSLGIKSKEEFAEYVAAGQWKNDRILLAWANQNVVAKIRVADKLSPSGETIIGIPRWMTSKTRSANEVRKDALVQLTKLSKENPDDIVDNVISVKMAKDLSQRAVKTKEEVVQKFKTMQMEDDAALRLRKVVALRRELDAQRQAVRRALGAKRSAKAIAKEKQKARFGTGKFVAGGVEVSDALATVDGRYMAGVAANGNSSLSMSSYAIARQAETTSGKVVNATDPEYFESVALFINRMMRNPDGSPKTIAKKVLEGDSVEDITKFLENTTEGRALQKQLGIGRYADPKHPKNVVKTAEEFAAEMHYSINNYVPGGIRENFLAGEEITSEILRDRFGDLVDELPPLIGLFTDPKQMASATERALNTIGKINRFLSDIPNQTVYQTPIFTGAYRAQMVERVNAFRALNGRAPNISEVAGMEKAARNTALKEVRKFTYNVVNNTRLEEAIRLVSPFIAAQIWQVKSLAWAASQNPARLAYISYMFDKAQKSMPWVDRDGNPSEGPVEGGSITFRLSPEFQNIVKQTPFLSNALKEVKQISFSTRSLDPIFGGEMLPFLNEAGVFLPNPFMPSVGPLVSIPVSEMMKNTPDNPLLEWLNKYVVNVLPYGPSDEPGSLDLAVPGRAAQLTLDRVLKKGEWLTTYNQILIYESGQYEMGFRDRVPTVDELTRMTNEAYDLKMGSALFSPISTQYQTERDLARNLYRSYITAYGQEEGYRRFITEHGDLIYATISTSKNPYGVDYTADSVENLKKYKELTDEIMSMGEDAADMLPFIINTAETSEFDAEAYAWLRSNKPSPGSSNYLTNMSEQEIRQKVSAAYGWADWKKGMDKIDSIAMEQGVNPDDETFFATLKTQLREQIRQKKYGDDWYREFSNINPQKYQDRATALEIAFNNTKWIASNRNNPTIKAIDLFISARSSIKDQLVERYNAGGSGSLSQNPDLKEQYYNIIYELKKEDIGFSEFHNRYFEGDRIS